jgi:hypothetical protein
MTEKTRVFKSASTVYRSLLTIFCPQITQIPQIELVLCDAHSVRKPVTHNLQRPTYRSLLTPHCLLLTAYSSLLTAYCLLLTAYSSLLTVHFSLP